MATEAAVQRYNGKGNGALGTDDPFYARATTQLLAQAPADPKEVVPGKRQVEEWKSLYDHHEQRFQALWNWRLPFWQTWGQIARYMRPYRYYAFVVENTYSQGLREDFAILDRAATQAGEICAAGLMSTLTDPDRLWLELGPAVPNLELDDAGKKYYEDLTERLNYIYDHSNFYDAQAQQYDDLTFFGTGVVIDYESQAKIINCRTPCAGEYCLGVNFDNGTSVLYEEFRQTVGASIEMFGVENCPNDMLQMWREKGGATEYENVIRHAIEPNFSILDGHGNAFDPMPNEMSWRETYWVRSRQNLKPLSLTGFHEQPFATTRWALQGNEAYGRGVGENMLGDAIQLQLETRQKAESIEKVNRPPMGADVSLQNQPTSQTPGGITYMNTGNGGEKKLWSLYEIKPDIPALTEDIKIIQERIARTGYNDVFQILMTLRQQLQLKADITATEVEQLTQEVLTRLGPIIWRVYAALQQRVRRHLAIMDRRGLLPQKPASLRGVPLKIDFISLLTEAKRKVKTQAIARTVQFVGTLEASWPEARYKVDIDEAISLFNDGVGGPVKIIRSKADTDAAIAAAAKDAQSKQLMAQTLPGARAAEALSRTSLGPGSALSALVGNPSGGGP